MAVDAHAIAVALDDDLYVARTPQERLHRAGGWAAAALVVLMLLSVAWSVQSAEWSDGLALVQTAVLGGAVLGLLLALTGWSAGFASAYSLLACLAWSTTLLIDGMLGRPDLHTGIMQILQRASIWGTNVVNRTPSADNLMFVLQLLVLGWWMGYFAMWSVIRHHRAWLAAVPAGIGLMFNAYYSPKSMTGFLLLFLLSVLMLVIRVELARNETRWQMARVRYAPDIYLDFLRDGFVFALIVIALTWLAPNSSGQRVIQSWLGPLDSTWHDMQNTWNTAFSNLRYPARAQVSTYGKALTLGGAVNLTDQPIFQAQVTERTYWRAAAFDTYTGQQWLNTDKKTISVDKNKTLPEPDYQLTHEISATIRTLQGGQDVLFAPPQQPIRASLPVNADVTPLGTGDTSLPQNSMVSLMRSRTSMAPDTVYQVASRDSNAPPDLLRTVGNDYPQQILQRYTQLPSELPDRVKRLAQQITAGKDTPYDKAVAIEAYVRQFPYNTQIAPPPSGQDGVDYFLFDLRQGYCDYYASAMAVMLRSVGVPARFVVGYTPGETSDGTNYVVQERNAHAWTEVYFTGYGWIQFEPTASQPLLSRPTPSAEQTPTPTPPGGDLGAGRANRQDNPGDIQDNTGAVPLNPAQGRGFGGWLTAHEGQAALALLAIALLVVLYAVLAGRWRKLLVPDGGLLLRLFDTLGGWAARLHVPWLASQTPLERAGALGQAVPQVAEPANRLAGLFVAQQYGRLEPEPTDLEAAAGDWRAMQPALVKGWVRRVLGFRPRWLRNAQGSTEEWRQRFERLTRE